MNRKQRRATRAQDNGKETIRFSDANYTLGEAKALAITEYGRGNLQAAADIFQMIIAQVPGNAEAYSSRGSVLAAMKNFNEALAHFDRAIALDPNHAATHGNRGNVLKELGQYEKALANYDKAIAIQPDFAVAHNARAAVLYIMKRYGEALSSYDKAIALQPNSAIAHTNRGLTLHELKRDEEALASYDKAIAIAPDFAMVFNNRSAIFYQTKQYDKALSNCDQAIALQPGLALPHNNRGLNLHELKRYPEALESYNKAIALSPDYADAHYNRGNALLALQRYDSALASYDKAIALIPGYTMAYNNRGITLQELKRYDEALASLDKAIAIEPLAKAYFNRGNILQTLKLCDESVANYDKAIALNPDYAEAYHNRGITLSYKGDMQGAEAMFYKSLATRPDYVAPVYSLSQIRKYKEPDHPDVHHMQKLLANPATPENDREWLYFALGKIYDDCKRYDEAFECYRQGNKICNEQVAYNHNNIHVMFSHIMDVFSRDFLAQAFSFSSNSRKPLFIVGMPRSGTTLMASILSNHPSIDTAGELTAMTDFTINLPKLVAGNISFPNVIRHLTPAIASNMINDYENRLQRDTPSTIPYIIDKHPMNFRNLGLISILFPHATIIHCTRHPLDVCLSNYFQHFQMDYDYTFDLQNCARFYGEYMRLMEHWRQALPKGMVEVSYEDMTMNSEPAARKMLEALGLEWDERCLSPHTNTSVVETASKWQVRQPIYKQSVEKWRHYEKYLQPLKDMLQIS